MLTPEEHLRKFPVTERQAQLLRAFARGPEGKLTLHEVARRMGTRHHNSNYQNIWQLMKKGLLGQDPLRRNLPGSYYVTTAGKAWLEHNKEAGRARQTAKRTRRSFSF